MTANTSFAPFSSFTLSFILFVSGTASWHQRSSLLRHVLSHSCCPSAPLARLPPFPHRLAFTHLVVYPSCHLPPQSRSIPHTASKMIAQPMATHGRRVCGTRITLCEICCLAMAQLLTSSEQLHHTHDVRYSSFFLELYIMPWIPLALIFSPLFPLFPPSRSVHICTEVLLRKQRSHNATTQSKTISQILQHMRFERSAESDEGKEHQRYYT